MSSNRILQKMLKNSRFQKSGKLRERVFREYAKYVCQQNHRRYSSSLVDSKLGVPADCEQIAG